MKEVYILLLKFLAAPTFVLILLLGAILVGVNIAGGSVAGFTIVELLDVVRFVVTPLVYFISAVLFWKNAKKLTEGVRVLLAIVIIAFGLFMPYSFGQLLLSILVPYP